MSALINRVCAIADAFEAENGRGAVRREILTWAIGALAFALVAIDLAVLVPMLSGGGHG